MINHDHMEEKLFDTVARCAMHEDGVMISETLLIKASPEDKEEYKNAA